MRLANHSLSERMEELLGCEIDDAGGYRKRSLKKWSWIMESESKGKAHTCLDRLQLLHLVGFRR